MFQNSRFFRLNFMVQVNCMYFVHLPDDRDLLNPNEKSVFTVRCFRFSAMLSAGSYRKKKNKRSRHHTPKRGWPSHLATKHKCVRHRYSGRFEFLLNNTYILLHMYYCCKIECEVTMLSEKIRSNAEIVCHEQTVMTRVASDIQSSSRRNSGGRRLVLKPLTAYITGAKAQWRTST